VCADGAGKRGGYSPYMCARVRLFVHMSVSVSVSVCVCVCVCVDTICADMEQHIANKMSHNAGA
jgi:hypothetical protein